MMFATERKEIMQQVVNAYHRDGSFSGTVILQTESH
jgi:hypothetical protein